MRACGLCGSDLEKIRGTYTAAPPVLGHEPAGGLLHRTARVRDPRGRPDPHEPEIGPRPRGGTDGAPRDPAPPVAGDGDAPRERGKPAARGGGAATRGGPRVGPHDPRRPRRREE